MLHICNGSMIVVVLYILEKSKEAGRVIGIS